MTVRDAQEGDLARILEIYNEVIATSTAIYRDAPATLDDRLAWWRAKREAGYPTLVADDGRHGARIRDVRRFQAVARLPVHCRAQRPRAPRPSWPRRRHGADAPAHRTGGLTWQARDDRRRGRGQSPPQSRSTSGSDSNAWRISARSVSSSTGGSTWCSCRNLTRIAARGCQWARLAVGPLSAHCTRPTSLSGAAADRSPSAGPRRRRSRARRARSCS